MSSIALPSVSGIYRITCTANGKFYIGSAVNLRRRRNAHFRHLRRKTHANPKLQNAWNKYGEDSFIIEVLEFVLIPEFLLVREQYWLDTLKPPLNIATVAGSTLGIPSPLRGRKLSPDHIEKHRQAIIGRKASEEARRNMAKARKGRKHSPETREKQRMALLGHPTNEETRAKISAANTGRIQSEETKAKLRDARSKRASPSAETRAKMSASIQAANEHKMKTIIVIAPDGTEHVVHGIKRFCKEHGLNSANLMRVAKGIYTHHKGWKARYP
jgi:group I intron endonuclease